MKIILIGMPACGKTKKSKIISNEFNIPLFDSDKYIEDKYKMSIQKIFTLFGEKEFRKIEHKILKEILKEKKYVLATGGGLPCFYNNIDLINSAGNTFFLNINLYIIFKRIKKFKTKKPLFKGLNNDELFNYLLKLFEIRKKYYTQAKYIYNEKNGNLIDFIKEKLTIV